MGGKKNQRTKGNTRPSNSGRIAELLSASGAPVTCFVGFRNASSDITTSGYGSATVAGSTSANTPEDNDLSLGSDLQMLMKKMTKKDAVTKLKSIQEFTDLIKQKDENLIKSLLPHWPRLYTKIAMDLDWRVREAAHRAHQQVVLKARRNLAPHLRSVMGIWLISQCDPYPPASSAALAAFKSAFPLPEKQAEVYGFCKCDVVNFVQDMLFQQTAQTISDPKVTSEEEMESKYNRLVFCCLEGLCILISSLTEDHRDELADSLTKIVSNDIFWKLRKNKDVHIQAAWHKVITIICKHMPLVITPFAAKVSQAVLGVISASDSITVQAMWESILMVLVTIPNAWQYVSMKKMVLPQLFKVLRQGAKGNAAQIFPHVLPFLSQFPDDVINISFYTDFFACMKQGMNEQSVLNSMIELNAIILSFMECARFVLIKHAEATDENVHVHNLIIVDNMLLLLKTSISEKDSKLSSSGFYQSLTDLVYFIGNQAHLDVNEMKRKGFTNMFDLFWDTFFSICDSLLMSKDVPNEWELQRLADFFHTLHHLRSAKSKSDVRVRFKDDDTMETKAPTVSKSTENETQPLTTSLSQQAVVSSTYKLCVVVIQKLFQKMHLAYLKLLAEIIKCAPSEKLFISLHQEKDQECDGGTPEQFFSNVIYYWLKDYKSQYKTIRERHLFVENIVDIVCVLINCIDKQVAEGILNQLCQLNDPYVVQCIFQAGVQINIESALTNWLKSKEAGNIVVKMARELLELSLSGRSEKDDEDDTIDCMWKTLQICFKNLDEKPIVALSCIEEVLSIFHSTLVNIDAQLSQLIEFSCELALSLFSSYAACWELPGTEELLLALFTISSEGHNLGSLNIKVEDAWQVGVRHLFKVRGGFFSDNKFFAECATHLQAKLENNLKSKSSVHTFVHTVVKLLNTVYENTPGKQEGLSIFHEPTVSLLLNSILPTEEQWENLDNTLPDVCLVHCAATGKFLFISSPCFPCNIGQSIPMTVLSSLAVLQILNDLLDSHSSANKDDAPKDGSMLVNCEIMLKHLPHLLFAYSYCKGLGFDKNSKQTNAANDEKYNIVDEFKKNITHCVTSLDLELRHQLLQYMVNKANKSGQAWALALCHTLEIMADIVPLSNLFLEQELFPCVSLEQIQTLQCIIPHASNEYKEKLLTMSANMLLCSEDCFAPNGAVGCLSILSTCLNFSQALDKNADDIAAVLEYLSSMKKVSPHYFGNDQELINCRPEILAFCSQVALFMQMVLNQFHCILTPDSWDFLLCTLTSWIEALAKNKTSLSVNIPLVNLAYQSFLLVENVARIITNIPESLSKETYPENLYVEWTEFFSDHIYQSILPMFLYLTGLNLNEDCSVLCVDPLMEAISSTLKYISVDHILKANLDINEVKIPKHESIVQVPPRINRILDRFCPLMVHKNCCVQLGAHTIVWQIMSSLPEKVVTSENDASELTEKLSPPYSIVKVLKETNLVVDAMLMEFTAGNCCIVQPYTDSYTYTLGYLLVWIEVLEFFSNSNSEERSKYATYFQESGLLSSLLLNLFRLMPVINLVLPDNFGKNSRDTNFFIEPPTLQPSKAATSTQLQHLSCHVYLATLRKLPALVRQWWMSLDKVTADIVNKYTSKFVSGLICTEEIRAVQNASRNFENMSVQARPIAREVVATYTIDDAAIELVIQLPANHPLGVINVESRKKVKVGNTQWRNWMLQLTMFLMHQNGSILDALSLWKRNIDKRFEGVEECMICFSVLHGSTCQLPRLTCRTCKKKFHSFCLYKWFSTSNNSSCPLCRNIF